MKNEEEWIIGLCFDIDEKVIIDKPLSIYDECTGKVTGRKHIGNEDWYELELIDGTIVYFEVHNLNQI